MISRRGFFGIAVGAAAATVVAPTKPAAPVLHDVVYIPKSGSTLQAATYKWGSFHDGFDMDEQTIQELLRENMETLKCGFEENFDLMLTRSV